MKFIKKSWDFLGSRKLSVFIFVMAIVYYLLLYAFSLVVPDWWLANLSKLLPYKVLYLLFVINLVICEIKWIPAVLRRCKKPAPPASPEDLKRFRDKSELAEDSVNAKAFASYLKKRLYTVSEGKRHGELSPGAENPFLLYAYGGRFSPLGNVMFHIAFILILTGIYVSLQYRFEGKVYLVEGQKFTGTYGEYAQLHAAPGADFMKTPFLVKDIKTDFWGSHLLFTDLRADITSGEKTFPVWLSKAGSIDGYRITIEELNYTASYILSDKNGRLADQGAVNLANFGPGSFDSFQIPGFPYKISLSIYPDAVLSEGMLVNRSMNLNNPASQVKVVKNKRLLYSGVVKGGQPLFFDDYKLSFPKISYNGAFSIVRDPGLRWIIASFFMMITGLVWRMIFCRNEVALVQGEGKVFIYTRSDYYPVTFKGKCSKVAMTKGRAS
ncbi:MAG: cytochrome c biogenesis protein ResB [Deltaproteobacteria bacterium]|nr:cytochrome c biogenesis protein ResB [Deltaproteobacteria bacterium]